VKLVRILGIDPGTRVAGYGIVDLSGQVFRAHAMGVWRLPPDAPLHVRLGALATELQRLIDAQRPDVLCLELAFVASNPRTALSLGHARGVILAVACHAGLEVHEISATAAKKSITGYGRAEKIQVAQALERLLGLSLKDVPLDASDALSIAYAHGLRVLLAPISSTLPSTNRAKIGRSESAYGGGALGAKRRRTKRRGFESLLKEGRSS
jgi:crossover junction endodeoxyribonuclease RuvC